jgi:SOS response regulatory protein OraA/RecX
MMRSLEYWCGWGKRRVERELGHTGIEHQIVDETLAQIFENDNEIETVIKVSRENQFL